MHVKLPSCRARASSFITGLLEKGMEESAQAALSYVDSRSQALGLELDFYQKVDVHIHFPEFVRKDGPSAGVTMATSLASALMRVPVRRDVAMTGEITLRGRVMPIGGVKEKLLAPTGAQSRTVIMPKENRKDLRDVPRRVLKATRVVLVDHMDDVLREALCLGPAAERLLGAPRERWEYRCGELVISPVPEMTPPGVNVPIPGGAPSPKAPVGGPSERVPPLV